MKNLFAVSLAIMIIMSFGTQANAVLLGPVNPPVSGGYTGGSGTLPGDAGGLRWDYAGFNMADYNELLWAPYNIRVSLDGNNHSTLLSYSSSTGTQSIWHGTALWDNPDTPDTNLGIVSTRLRVTNSDGWLIDATGLGINGGAVDVAGDFSVRLFFEAFQGGWIPINTLEQLPGGLTRTSVYAGFWQDEAPAIPEPGTMLLLSIGLAGLVGFRKKLNTQ